MVISASVRTAVGHERGFVTASLDTKFNNTERLDKVHIQISIYFCLTVGE